MANLPGWSEVVERVLGPDEGPWEVSWVSGRDEKGELIRSSRRFLTQEQAELFKANNCGMSLIDMLRLMQETSPKPLYELEETWPPTPVDRPPL